MILVHDLRRVSADTAGAWAYHIAAHMRLSDKAELQASSQQHPLDALKSSLGVSSHAWCIESDREGPVAMFGAAPSHLPGLGIVWMLGTDGIRTEAHAIARQTRPYLDVMNDEYHTLFNYIDARNSLSMRWLRWGGFEIVADHPHHGPEGRLFHSFARSAHV